jgi:hypothetical protein
LDGFSKTCFRVGAAHRKVVSVAKKSLNDGMASKTLCVPEGRAIFRSLSLMLINYSIKGIGAHGENLGERLKNSENKFHDRESYQSAWEGHKERNRLVHEHDYELLHHQARTAIDNFKKALRGLGVL